MRDRYILGGGNCLDEKTRIYKGDAIGATSPHCGAITVKLRFAILLKAELE